MDKKSEDIKEAKELVSHIQHVCLSNPSQVTLYDVLTNVMIDMLRDGYSKDDVIKEIERLTTPREEV